MNVEAYIASGILEAYVQGELSAEERAEVEKNLRQYPELRKELASIEQVQEALLQRMAVIPKASVKDAIFSRLSAGDRQNEVRTIDQLIPQSNSWKLAAAAAIVLALITSYMAFDYRSRWKNSQRELSELAARNEQVAKDYETVNERLERLEVDLGIINNPAFNRVVLRGTEQSPSALASVYWNETSKEVYLSIQELKDISAEKQYQLWAIIDGKPVDAGVFDLTKGRLVRMRNIGVGATTFAVTIEPKGGKLTPSLETMQVSGNVVKG